MTLAAATCCGWSAAEAGAAKETVERANIAAAEARVALDRRLSIRRPFSDGWRATSWHGIVRQKRDAGYNRESHEDESYAMRLSGSSCAREKEMVAELGGGGFAGLVSKIARESGVAG